MIKMRSNFRFINKLYDPEIKRRVSFKADFPGTNEQVRAKVSFINLF